MPREHKPITDDAERLLGNMLRPGQIQRQLIDKWKISPRTAQRYIDRVRSRWRLQGADLKHEERSERKEALRHAAQEQYAVAVAAAAMARQARNAAAMATASRAAANCLKLLADLDGLAGGPQVVVQAETIDARTQVAVVQAPSPGGIVQESNGTMHDPDTIRRRSEELVQMLLAAGRK